MFRRTLSIFREVVNKRNRSNVGRYMLEEHRMLIKVPSFNWSVVAGIITVNRFTARYMENFKYQNLGFQTAFS